MNARRLSTLALLGVVLSLASPCSRGANWFVDPAAVGGSQDGTSWANAWTDLPLINWTVVNPGDTVYLSGGLVSQLYAGDFLNPLAVGKSGTPGNPITISIGQDAGHNGVATLSGQYINLQGNNYITLSGNVGGAQHLLLSDFYDTTERSFGNKVLADGTTGFTMAFCIASNVNQGVSLVGAQGFNVASNTVYARGDAAVRAVNSPDNGFDSHFVTRNLIILDYATNQPTYLGPDGVQGSHGLTIASNLFTIRRVGYKTSTQHPDYTQLIGNHLKIYANTFLNIGDSANDFDWWANPSPHDILIYNNVYNIDTAIDPFPEYIRWYASAGQSFNSVVNFQIVANTFANNATWPNLLGTWGASGTPALTNFRISDNVFYGGTFNVANNFGAGAYPASITISNNVYAPGFTNTWLGTNYSAAAMVAGPDPTGVAGVPSFVDPASDFHYATNNSVGVGAGLALNSLFTTDKDGVTRGATWDDGAYQFVGSVTNLPPNTPSNNTPLNGATGVALSPTIGATAYSDPQGNGFIASEFQVYASDGVTLLLDHTVIPPRNFWVVTPPLSYSTTYKFRARYENSLNLWSGWSTLTSFTTLAQPPVSVKLHIDRIKTNQGRGK